MVGFYGKLTQKYIWMHPWPSCVTDENFAHCPSGQPFGSRKECTWSKPCRGDIYESRFPIIKWKRRLHVTRNEWIFTIIMRSSQKSPLVIAAKEERLKPAYRQAGNLFDNQQW